MPSGNVLLVVTAATSSATERTGTVLSSGSAVSLPPRAEDAAASESPRARRAASSTVADTSGLVAHGVVTALVFEPPVAATVACPATSRLRSAVAVVVCVASVTATREAVVAASAC
ncbi:hypothetical protein GCM10027414_14160 [Humibacter ginsengiterrae]